jgi:putative phage-type endonuclease
MYDYVHDHPRAVADPDFHDTMVNAVCDAMSILLDDNDDEDTDDEVNLYMIVDRTIVELAADLFYATIMPPRSSVDTGDMLPLPRKEQITHLQGLIQPAQRSPEWYAYRANVITASNGYKVFESEAQRNSLIYEKCAPPKNFSGPGNVDSPMHWGQKYEPLSTMLYEHRFKTTVGAFGCIQHPKHVFLGASPDGINIDPASRRYGRMLEIKNVVSRVITGVPPKAYWIQMQLQMEVCDLDYCDFLETRFVERQPDDQDWPESLENKEHGVIAYLADDAGMSHYIYAPIGLTSDQWQNWSNTIVCSHEHRDKYFVRLIEWRLDVWSCVLVERNRLWFESNVQDMADLWDIVVQERATGYEHRAPQKREITSKGCLLKINKLPELTV